LACVLEFDGIKGTVDTNVEYFAEKLVH
jgi:hypothetical protein